MEDEGYYWNLSRYIHLNPCSGGKPLAESPELYPYSSYAGYARKTRRVDWIDYDQHHRYWAARNGGDPASAYRQFVKDGLDAPADPMLDRLKDWVTATVRGIWSGRKNVRGSRMQRLTIASLESRIPVHQSRIPRLTPCEASRPFNERHSSLIATTSVLVLGLLPNSPVSWTL